MADGLIVDAKGQPLPPTVVPSPVKAPETPAPQTPAPAPTQTQTPAPAPVPDPHLVALDTDINGRIEKARQEERSKLYGKLSSLEREIETLRTATKPTLPTPPVSTPAPTGTPAVSGQGTPTLDPQAVATLAAEAVLRSIQPTLESINKEREERRKAEERSRLDTYAQQKIAEARGRIIPEMVRGSSFEEIDTAALIARQRFESIAASFSPTSIPVPAGQPAPAPGTVPQQSFVSTTTAAPRPAGNGQTPEQGQPTPSLESSLSQDVRSLSREEYAKKRKELRGKATQVFAEQQANQNPMLR